MLRCRISHLETSIRKESELRKAAEKNKIKQVSVINQSLIKIFQELEQRPNGPESRLLELITEIGTKIDEIHQ